VSPGLSVEVTATRFISYLAVTLTYSHYATYASAVHGFSPKGRKSLSTTRKQLYSSLPRQAPLGKAKGLSLGFPRREKRFNGMFTYDKDTKSYLLVRCSGN
jgi:hypothetical protein